MPAAASAERAADARHRRAGVGRREKAGKGDRYVSMNYIWLIPLLPGIGAAINGLVGIRFFSRRVAGVVACAMMTAALGISVVAFWQLLQLHPEARAFDYVV